jgi:hypothetical protein
VAHDGFGFGILALTTAAVLTAAPAEGVVLQVDGTLVPETTNIQPGLNQGENGSPYTTTTTPPTSGGAGPKGPIDPVFEAATTPEVFLIPKDEDGHFGIVTFIDLLEGAGFENTFGWYNVGDDLNNLSNLHTALSCTPTNYEATPSANSQVSVDFQAEADAGRYKGGFIGFFLVTPEGCSSCGNCGNPGGASQVGRIYYTERPINGDGNYVHYLIYQTKVTDADGVRLDDYYFGFEDLYRGGDNDFEDMLIFVRGLVAPCEPTSEICDGLDNNCDGLVDNDPVDSGGACTKLAGNTGVGECQAGTLECASTGPGDTTQECVGEVGPTDEVCNGLDDDCDGTPDNPPGGNYDPPLPDACDPIYSNPPCSAQTACVDGKVTCVISQAPVSETCNSIDDDCDGIVDDDPDDVGDLCTDHPGDPTVGECHAGETVCDDGSLVCDGYQGPEDEVCDNKDNDCDGDVDEVGGTVDVGQACSPTGVDVCQPGQTQCVGGVLTCTGFTTGRPETCNGLDDDCNGSIDDDPLDIGGPCGENRGECEPGHWECLPTTPGDLSTDQLTCVGGQSPETEQCDGKDNDCDGHIDSPGPLPGEGTACTNGCGTGVYHCQRGELRCDAAGQGSHEVCNGIDDDCDGQVDEADDLAEVGIACFDDGIQLFPPCQPGKTECVAHDGTATVECVGATHGTSEVCDGVDNDCDGKVDGPGLMPGAGDACTTDCGPGIQYCRDGQMICESAGTREVCNGIDDDCDGEIDEAEDLAEVGIACFVDDVQLYPPCEPGKTECVAHDDGTASVECVGATQGGTEICDGVDNDCDGNIDGPGLMPGEGAACTTACGPGLERCRAGEMICEAGASESREVCDGLDNDCDGKVDEASDLSDVGITCFKDEKQLFPPCRAGKTECVARTGGGAEIDCVGATQGSTEICDGIDNDCDGQIDGPGTMPGEGDACTTDCGPGEKHCHGGKLVCELAGPGAREECNGVDDDCDGEVDEPSDLSEVGIACFPGGKELFPPCQAGVTECVPEDDGGAAIECVEAVEGSAEVCDGIDNDCNGIIDDGTFADAGKPCLTETLETLFGDLDEDQELPGECRRGVLACVQQTNEDGEVVAEIGCIDAVEPTDEICDGKDNDCDGVPDSPQPCPGESECVAGQCNEPCTVMGEFVICPGGLECKNGWCVDPHDPDTGEAAGAPGVGAGGSSSATGGASLEGGSDAAGGEGSTETAGSFAQSDDKHDRGSPLVDSDGDGKIDEYGLASGGSGCAFRVGTRNRRVVTTLALLAMGAALGRRRRRTSREGEVVS